MLTPQEAPPSWLDGTAELYKDARRWGFSVEQMEGLRTIVREEIRLEHARAFGVGGSHIEPA